MYELNYADVGEIMHECTLENGLRVYVFPRKGYQKKFACFAVNYGGADIRFRCGNKTLDTPAGIAHFLEHKMFDMPDGSNALTVLSANGASPNAMTGFGMTAYHFSCVDNFEENLRMLLRFVSTPFFTPESVKKEQGIIGQEIRMIEDDPTHRIYSELLRCIYSKSPVINGVAGTVDSIADITDETLYDCHRIFYTPSNMVLCVAGFENGERICDIAREMITAPFSAPPEHDYGEAEGPTAVKPSSSVKMAVSKPQFLIGAKLDMPPKGKEHHRSYIISELASQLLAGSSSRLYLDLYNKGLINSDFAAQADMLPNEAMMLFAGESSDPNAVYDAIKNECAELIGKGCSESDFERVRKSLYGRFLRELNSFENMCYNQVDGFINEYRFLDSYSILTDITREEVREFAGKNLLPEKMAISVAVPA